jgi:hypothetical protein
MEEFGRGWLEWKQRAVRLPEVVWLLPNKCHPPGILTETERVLPYSRVVKLASAFEHWMSQLLSFRDESRPILSRDHVYID